MMRAMTSRHNNCGCWPTEEGTLEEATRVPKGHSPNFRFDEPRQDQGRERFLHGQEQEREDHGEQFNETAAGGRSMHLDVPTDTAYINHVHPDLGTAEPSPKDRETSQNFGVPIYAVSKHGLYMARPSDGQVVKVFDGTNWMSKDFQGNKAFNDGINPDGYDSSHGERRQGNHRSRWQQGLSARPDESD